MADDGVRPAGFIRHSLHPRDLVLEPVRRPVGLHVDRTRHPAVREVVEILVDEVVAPDRLVGTEDPRLHRPEQPREIGLAPDVVVRVDDRETGHRGELPPDRFPAPPGGRRRSERWSRRTAAPPARLRARAERQQVAAERLYGRAVAQIVEVRRNRGEGRGLGAECGVGREGREPAHPPRQPGQACDGGGHRVGSAALEPVREHHHDRSARKTGKAGHCEKGAERIADAGAAVPVGHQAGRPGERRLGVAQPERPGDPGEPGAEGEALHALGRPMERVREPQRGLGVLLHRAGDVDEQQDPALPARAPAPRKHRRIAALSHRGAQRARQVDGLAPTRPPAAQAPAARQALRRLAGESAQALDAGVGLESPAAEHLRRGGGLAGFARFGGVRRLVDGATVVVYPHLGLVLALARNRGELAVEPGAEQGVELPAPLARRTQGRHRGTVHVVDATRPQQLHRLEERHRLIGRGHESEAAEERREARQMAGGCRHRGGAAHSAYGRGAAVSCIALLMPSPGPARRRSCLRRSGSPPRP